jgi:hypothetical protein
MSPNMSMPPRIHCPDPPNSRWLNWAIPPFPFNTATSICVTASALKP